MNNQCVAETQGRLHFSALHEKSASPGRLHGGPDLDFQVTAVQCRNCDGLKVLSWTEGVQEQLSTNCAAYAHSAAPGHSVSAAAQAGPRPVAAAAGHRRRRAVTLSDTPGRPRRDPLARLPRRA